MFYLNSTDRGMVAIDCLWQCLPQLCRSLATTMSSIEQLRHEGLCLRYPENLGQHANITYEMAVSMLIKAAIASQTVPFQWGWIDRPAEGQVFLVFIGGGMSGMTGSSINDGIRYQEMDNRYVIPADNNRVRLSPLLSRST